MLCELDVLKKCPVCGHTTVQLTRIDSENKVSVVRKSNKKAEKFLKKLKPKIIYEEDDFDYSKIKHGKFYLNYNDYGIKRRCYSNLRNLKKGLKDFL